MKMGAAGHCMVTYRFSQIFAFPVFGRSYFGHGFAVFWITGSYQYFIVAFLNSHYHNQRFFDLAAHQSRVPETESFISPPAAAFVV
jgi:hypothetical protein